MIDKIRVWMQSQGYDGIILSRRDNYIWATQGDENFVLSCAETGIAVLLVTHDMAKLYVDSSDANRMRDEQNRIGAEVVEIPWYECAEETLQCEIRGRFVVSDTGILGTKNVQAQLVNIRLDLDKQQINCYREIGKSCAKVVEQICMDAKPGQTEEEISYLVKANCLKQGISPDCVLVGSDERITQYRHPMPTNKKIEHSLMVVLGGARSGLNVSITRMVYFGGIPADIADKYRKNQEIFASMQMMMRDGMSGKEYFGMLQELYNGAGYEDEWKKHHQGGPTGYACREIIIAPETDYVLREGHVYAWNPTIAGVKCEETTYFSGTGIEILTRTDKWPVRKVETVYGCLDVAEIFVKQ